MSARITGIIVLSCCPLAACMPTDGAGDPDAGPLPVDANLDTEHEAASDLTAEFARATAQWGVPEDLLMAIAFEETRWQSVSGNTEFDDKEPGHGIMGLTDARIALAAELTGYAPEDIRDDRLHNIIGAAAVMASAADELGLEPGDLGAWAPVVAWYSGIEDPMVQSWYVHDGVYRVLADGVQSELASLSPQSVTPDFTKPPAPGRLGDQAGAVWRPSPNRSARPSGASGDPSMVIIHTCEGSYAGCWGWLTNPTSGVSAHYVINNSGTEVSQLVSESEKAWHIGATYDCSKNSDTDCWRNGEGSNGFTVGIEHAGYASQSSWAPQLISTSAELLCDISDRNGIPLDRYHVVGHGQLQPYNRVDPGASWPWSDYLAQASAACSPGGGGSTGGGSTGGGSTGGGSTGGGSTGGGSSTIDIVIDSNPLLNGPDAEIEVSLNWTASNNVEGYYHTGYWWRSTGASTDGASFWFYLATPARLTVEAWWPPASDRSTSAPFIMLDGGDRELGRVSVDQRNTGGSWVELGTWDFPAGWNRALLSRWTTPGSIVVADAVRVHTP